MDCDLLIVALDSNLSRICELDGRDDATAQTASVWRHRLGLSLVLPEIISARSDEAIWPAPGSEDTKLGVLMELEVGHGETEVYARV
jgi:hypothetical protein